MSSRQLLYDFKVEDAFEYSKDVILKEANRIAESEVRRLGYTKTWTLEESRPVEDSEDGLKVYYFEIYGEPTQRVLLIDDLRNIKADVVARTYEHGIIALKQMGPWDVLYLDHDLGDVNPSHTGYGVMCWLEANPEFLPKKVVLVTSNPVGRQNMQVVIDRLYAQKSSE